MKTIVFVTGNQGKVAELTKLTTDCHATFIQDSFGYPEIQAETLEDVALFGCQHVLQRLNKPFILEDAGLFIDALHGFPGVYSKYVYHSIGLDGVLRLLQGICHPERTATFRCVYALQEPQAKPFLFIGESKGVIITECRGDNGFGYDPIFMPDGSTKTFAEMTLEEKNQVSHRGKAIKQLKTYLKEKEKRIQ